MTIPAKRKSNNVKLSINKFIKDNLADVYSYDINYQDQLYDPSNFDQWIDVNLLSEGAGRKSCTLVQFDIYSRVRGGFSGGDRYGVNVSIIADRLHEALHVDGLQLYDFTNPSSCVAIDGAKLLVQNSNGTLRESEMDQVFDIEDGVTRRSITYRFRLLEDASNSMTYYD